MNTQPPEGAREIRKDWQEFWYKESKYTEQTYLTADTHGIVIDYIKQVLLSQQQKAREEQNMFLLAYQISLEAGEVNAVLTDIKNRIKVHQSELEGGLVE